MKGKKESPSAYNDVIVSKMQKNPVKNKVLALAGTFHTVIYYETASSKWYMSHRDTTTTTTMTSLASNSMLCLIILIFVRWIVCVLSEERSGLDALVYICKYLDYCDQYEAKPNV